MDQFIFETSFGGKQRMIGYRLTADKEVRIISIGGFAIKRDGSPIVRSDTTMKRLRREAKRHYVSNMRIIAGA